MEFKKFSAGTYSYGQRYPNPNKEAMKKEGITNVNFEDKELE